MVRHSRYGKKSGGSYGICLDFEGLGHSLIRNHPFVDGNKRTGYMSMLLFLNINGYDIRASQEESYKFVIEIAGKKKDEGSIAEWLKKHSQKIK